MSVLLGSLVNFFNFMETENPYLEPELTLPELADKLAVFPHHLSQVINREMNKSVFALSMGTASRKPRGS